MTREELTLIPEIEKWIRIKREQIKKLEEMATCLPGQKEGGRVQTSTKDHSMDAVIKMVDLKNELEAEYERLITLKKEAHEIIDELPRIDRELMALRYIYGKPWGEVAQLMEWSYRHTLRRHKKILEKLF